MHAHQARIDRIASEIELPRASRNLNRSRIPCGTDRAMVDDDRLIRSRGRAGSIDNPNVHERDHGIVKRHERLKAGRNCALCRQKGNENSESN